MQDDVFSLLLSKTTSRRGFAAPACLELQLERDMLTCAACAHQSSTKYAHTYTAIARWCCLGSAPLPYPPFWSMVTSV